jgi:hypothetical protein
MEHMLRPTVVSPIVIRPPHFNCGRETESRGNADLNIRLDTI